MRRIVLSAIAVVALSGVALADPPATASADAPAAAPSVALPTPPDVDANVTDDTIVCRWTSVIGSRMKDRLCLSKRRWKQMHQDGQDFMRNLDERSDGGQERGI